VKIFVHTQPMVNQIIVTIELWNGIFYII